MADAEPSDTERDDDKLPDRTSQSGKVAHLAASSHSGKLAVGGAEASLNDQPERIGISMRKSAKSPPAQMASTFSVTQSNKLRRFETQYLLPIYVSTNRRIFFSFQRHDSTVEVSAQPNQNGRTDRHSRSHGGLIFCSNQK